MCYYARTDYRCGDFKWGNMKLRCERQPRMGEVCGAKLADTHNLSFVDDDCRVCQDIETKKRRLRKEQDNIARWRGDRRNNFGASIEKATRESQILVEQIRELEQRRPSARLGPPAGRQGKSETRTSTANVSSHRLADSRHGGYAIPRIKEEPREREHDRHGSRHESSLPYRGSVSQSSQSYGGSRHAR